MEVKAAAARITILGMKSLYSTKIPLFIFCLILAQATVAFSVASAAVTIPAVVDHNRVIVSVDIPMPDGSTQSVRAWVDTGSTDLVISGG